MNKQRVIIVCPGRGSYTRDTKGYLKKYGGTATEYIQWMNEKRLNDNYESLTRLDSMPFRSKIHMIGENASPLIYACSLSDFLSIDQTKYDVVSIVGNSMGWYTALALSGSLSFKNGYELIQTMGSIMKDELIGGQVIYPIVDENWRIDKKLEELILDEIINARANISIRLGGYLVIGGTKSSLDILLKKLPKNDLYPFKIPFHAAFHTPLLKNISDKAFHLIDPLIFKKPSIPLIDGLGRVWSPLSTDTLELMRYTLGSQVTETYDFTSSINVAIKEFCPDKLILLGPGNSLGGPIGQIMVKNSWLGLNSKKDFSKLQISDPYMFSMGIDEQRVDFSKKP